MLATFPCSRDSLHVDAILTQRHTGRLGVTFGPDNSTVVSRGARDLADRPVEGAAFGNFRWYCPPLVLRKAMRRRRCLGRLNCPFPSIPHCHYRLVDKRDHVIETRFYSVQLSSFSLPNSSTSLAPSLEWDVHPTDILAHRRVSNLVLVSDYPVVRFTGRARKPFAANLAGERLPSCATSAVHYSLPRTKHRAGAY